jgi:Nucleoside recognition.
MVVIRTLSAFVLAFVLNKIMPGEVVSNVLNSAVEKASLKEMLTDWLYSTIRIVITMTILIFTLSILQKILSEFGVIRWISKFLRPLLAIFGLPAKTSFLWIVANTLGLAYGAAVMIEEYEGGKVNKSDIDLLNHHIAISHSNLEDVILLTSVGGIFWWLLLSRWAMSLLLVWELKAEMAIRKKYLPLSVRNY